MKTLRLQLLRLPTRHLLLRQPLLNFPQTPIREEFGSKSPTSLIGNILSFFPLLIVLYLSVTFSLFSQSRESDDHKANSSGNASILNRRILRIYEDLGVARELLKLERIDSVPNGTYISFLGNFPNRKGIRVTKHSISEGRSGIERAESKSILLEFTGTTLSRVITEVKAENADGSDTTTIRLIDETPLDQNVDDILVESNRNGKEMRYAIQLLPDEGINRERSAFKQEFYLKLLEDFLVQVLRLQEMQNQESAKNKKKLLQTFKDSLQY